jgi:hypothetical protein
MGASASSSLVCLSATTPPAAAAPTTTSATVISARILNLDMVLPLLRASGDEGLPGLVAI